ncbi:MAG: hypothetical protein ACQET5_07730 [Halobacteriota archaeon]|uniref:hypothetical protein n=1 Tax=Natronomonas sp. TaxID=2184060 RepID=UPI0039756499
MAKAESEAMVTHGVDTQKFHEFVEYVTGNPGDVPFELGARALYEGRLFHSLAKIDAYGLGDDEIHRETR